MSYEKESVRITLEILRDYHDTNISSFEFLKIHGLDIDALDNKFLKSLAKTALRDLEEL